MRDEVLDKYEHISMSDRVTYGRSYKNKIVDTLRNGGVSITDISNFLWLTLSVFVSADGRCSKEQYELVCKIWDLTKTSYQTFYEKTNGGSDPKVVNNYVKFVGKLNRDANGFTVSLALFGAIIMAAKGYYTENERKLYKKVLFA